MKAIVCEMCNSHDFKKADGLFVCENCGTKYSIEEAKKLMIEIDNSKKMSNLYERARKSLEVDDLEHAAEYYKQILDENPDDWEAYFYSYLGETTSFTNAQAASVALKLGSTIPAAYDMAVATGNEEEIAERVKLISEKTAVRLTGIALTAAALLKQYEGGNILSPVGKVHYDMYKNLRPTAGNTVANCVVAFDPLLEKLEELRKAGKISDDVYDDSALALLRVAYNTANMTFSPAAGLTEKLIKNEVIENYAYKIKALDPSFTMPEPKPAASSGGGGCYVATAVYGSYDCPEVWTLRRFRDDTLAETWYGRAFIRIYYAISPTLVKWFGKTEWFKNLWKPTLDRMVEKLNKNGVEDTPYDDKVW